MVYSDQSASPPAPAPAEGTRERVLQLVLTRGPVSAAEIGRELELTAAAVRRHLDALEEDSLVEVKRVTAARGAGRPSRRYVVTSHAQEHLPKDHLAVALDTLARLEELGRHYGLEVDPDELVAWGKEQFAAYKYPRIVEVVSELPMTSTGKILKRELS